MVKNSPANAEDAGYTDAVPGPGGPPQGGNSNLLPDSYLRNPMDKGAWWATVLGVAKKQGLTG